MPQLWQRTIYYAGDEQFQCIVVTVLDTTHVNVVYLDDEQMEIAENAEWRNGQAFGGPEAGGGG